MTEQPRWDATEIRPDNWEPMMPYFGDNSGQINDLVYTQLNFPEGFIIRKSGRPVILGEQGDLLILSKSDPDFCRIEKPSEAFAYAALNRDELAPKYGPEKGVDK